MNIFVGSLPVFQNRIKGCHGNNAISHKEIDLLFRNTFFLPLSDLIKPFDMNKKSS